MSETILHLVEHFGYVMVGLLILAEGLGVPMPGEASLVIGAALAATTGRLTLTGVIIAATLGAILGAAGGYRIGASLSDERLHRWAARFGFGPERLRRAQEIFRAHGIRTAILGRFVTLLRMLVAILAGASRNALRRVHALQLDRRGDLGGVLRHDRICVREQPPPIGTSARADESHRTPGRRAPRGAPLSRAAQTLGLGVVIVIRRHRLRSFVLAAAVPGAFALGAQGAPARAATDSNDCASCRFRQSAEAYRLAASRVSGAWHAYYESMAGYAGCMATSLRANAGRCSEPPRQPAGSPCSAPSAQGIAICNATLPPDKPGAEFVALPDGFKSIDLRQSAYTATGSVRYVWDAMRARAELAPAEQNVDRDARRTRRRYADSLLAVLARDAQPPPREERTFRAAMDAGIAEE